MEISRFLAIAMVAGVCSVGIARLPKQHISIAVDLIKAAKAGDKAAQQQADSKWQQNGVEIAEFPSKANPRPSPVRVAAARRIAR
jgi:hypothetical protein